MIQALIASLLVVSGGSAAPNCSNVEILQSGSFHADEIASQDLGTWLSLDETETGWELRETQPTLKRVWDVISDSMSARTDPALWTGWEVDTGNQRSLLLVRGFPGARPGPVKIWFVGSEVVPPGEGLFLGSGSFPVRLVAAGTRRPSETQGWVATDYRLKLDQGSGFERIGPRPLVTPERMDPENSIALRLVADLDRDGSADVLLDTGAHYNVSELSLYLSSCSTGGRLEPLSPVAQLRTVGC